MTSFASGLIQNNAENDSYTKLLLHMEGPDPNIVTADSSPSRQGRIHVPDPTKVVLAAVPKFGSTSLLMNSSWFYVRYSEDFNFDDGDFTIDWWEQRRTTSANQPSISSDTGANGYQAFLLGWSHTTTAIVYYQRSHFSTDGSTWNCVVEHDYGGLDTWYHLAVVRKGGTIYAFRNGVLKDSKPITGSLVRSYNAMGFGYYYSAPTTYLINGYMDEIRISKGIARWTANFTPPTRRYEPNPDTDTALLLHCNGATGSKNFVDASYTKRGQPNVYGTPIISQFISKFGNASMKFDGVNGNYIAFDDSTDWTFNNKYTLECWVNIPAYPSAGQGYAIASQSDEPTGLWILLIGDAGNLYFLQRHASTDWTVPNYSQNLVPNRWYHVAVTRNGINFQVYIDGVGGPVTPVGTPINFNSPLYIGTWKGTAYALNGYIDEFRVSRTIRYTSDFTVASQPHYPVDRGDHNTVFLADDSPYDKSSHDHGPWNVGTRILQAPQVGRWSFYFDGASTMAWPNHSDYNFEDRNWTVEWWEYRTLDQGAVVARDFTNGYTPFLFGYASGAGRYCYLTSNGSSWDILSSTDGGSFGTPSLNNWHHFAVQRNGGTIWLFLNGVIVNGKTISPATKILSNNASISFGGYASGTYMSGYVDSIRISNIARYTGNFTPSTTPYPP